MKIDDPNFLLLEATLSTLSASFIHFQKHKEQLTKYCAGGRYGMPQLPLLISKLKLQKMENEVNSTFKALQLIPQIYFNNDLRKLLSFTKQEDLSKAIERFPQDFVPKIYRPDAFFERDQLKIIEFNIGTSVGFIDSTQMMNNYFHEHPAFKLARKKISIKFFDPFDSLAKTLNGNHLTILHGFHKAADRQLPKNYFFDLKAEFIKTQALASLFNLKDHINKLPQGGFVFRAYPIDYFRRNGKNIRTLLNLLSQTQSKLFDSPWCDLLGNKLLLTLLSEKPDFLPFHLRKICRQTIPWTRHVKLGKTQFKSNQLDLINLISENKNSFVLKCAVGGMSKNVVAGKDVNQLMWNKSIDFALSRQNWVVQELVLGDSEQSLFFANDEIEFQKINRMISPFLVEDKIIGIASRTSIPKGPVVFGKASPIQTSGFSTVLVYN